MANIKQLIKEVAAEKKWTQAHIKRAIDKSGMKVNSKEDIYACLDSYAGQALKELDDKLRGQKALNTKLKNLVNKLVTQLSFVQNFYDNKLVPTLKHKIAEQASYIKELLEQVPNKLRK